MSGLTISALAVAAFVAMASGAPAALADVMARGQRLTTCTVDSDGVVTDSPQSLCNQAAATLGRAITLDAYALARMVRSEDGSAGQVAKALKCHVGFNQVASLGWPSVAYWVTYHRSANRAGKFGAQISGRVASGKDPYENDLVAAEYAIAERANGSDPTFGAVNFVDVGGFGSQAGTGTFDDLVTQWAAEGKVPGTLPNTPDGLVFFWRGNVPDGAESYG
jgi:hypothetical protein